MERYLIDTDVLIDAARGKNPAQARLLQLIANGDELGVCAIQFTEFYSGQARGRQPHWDAFLDQLTLWPITHGAALRAGIYRRSCALMGVAVLTPDALNAAVAWSVGAAVLTGNVRDYPMPDVWAISP